MGLRACNDCKNSISTSAKSCPHCGAPPPDESSLGLISTIIILMMIIAWVVDGCSPDKPINKPTKSATETSAPQEKHTAGKPQQETVTKETVACKRAGEISKIIGYTDTQKFHSESAYFVKTGQCIFLSVGEKVTVTSRAPFTSLIIHNGTELLTISSSLTKSAPPLNTFSQIKELPAPFVSPIQYIGLSINEAAKRVGIKPNSVGNIILESKTARMLVTTSGKQAISYVDIEFNQEETCMQSKEFDSKPFLVALKINPEKLELARKQTHFHTYYDHTNKLKIAVSCLADDSTYNVGLSKNNYLN